MHSDGGKPEDDTVEIGPHKALPLHLVYRREFPVSEPLSSPPSGVEFELFEAPWRAFRRIPALMSEFGLPGTLKLLAKVSTPSRCFFAVFNDQGTASYGWIMHGKCRLYAIEPRSSVIGPIHTRADQRGKGLAGLAMNLAMQRLASADHRIFYIDAHASNHASQRAISRAGFSGPVAAVPASSIKKDD